MVMATVEDLFEERGEEEKVWGSMVKQALKRRNPGFNETYHGFRTFGRLLEEASTRGLLQLEHDENPAAISFAGSRTTEFPFLSRCRASSRNPLRSGARGSGL